MKISKVVSSLVLAGVVAGIAPSISFASLASSGGVVLEPEKSQGQLGAIVVDPYNFSPQTAIINNNGKKISNVTVTIEPKKGGYKLSYKVPQTALNTHNGVPVFGLYANYNNKIHLEYTYKNKVIKETYKLYIDPIVSHAIPGKTSNVTEYTPTKSSKEFKDRLYFVNSLYTNFKPETNWVRSGGALGFAYPGYADIIDTKGDIRWHFDMKKMLQKDGWNLDKLGMPMSFKQLDNGDVIFLQAQRYMRYDILGRKVFDRRLPRGFIDAGHEISERPNGNIIIRVGKKDYLREDGKMVHTLKDHIVEMDSTGQVVHIWDLAKSMDPYRDVLLKALDQRAVCLSVDEHAGHMKVSEDAPWGDVTGVESGRNWPHANSVYYDESDNSIVVSLRHQGIAKIDKNDNVKWILSPFDGWKGKLAKKVLIPVDKNGKKLNCEGTNFDWSFTQHTAYLNPELGKGYLTVFDNGDGRGHEQPAMVEDKYSRAVAYKIDEKNGTVQQLWEYGKDRGFDWFSMVTSNVNYDKETKSFHTATLNVGLMKFKESNVGYLDEIKLDKNGKPYLANEIKVNYSSPAEFGYRSGIVKINKLFGK